MHIALCAIVCTGAFRGEIPRGAMDNFKTFAVMCFLFIISATPSIISSLFEDDITAIVCSTPSPSNREIAFDPRYNWPVFYISF